MPTGYNRLCGAMEYRVLGPLEAEDDGRAVDLGGSRQRALLAILLLNRGRVVPSDRLIEDLYGANPPPAAGKSLQAHVSRLRKAAGAGLRLHTRRGGYVLEVSDGDVDADRFARLLEEGRKALSAGNPADAARSLQRALDLWRGPALVDVAYEDFAQSEIARLEELRLAAVEELVDARLALGGHADVAGELEQLTQEHPMRERLRGQLMLALYRSGRQADALEAYQDARRALVDELGIEPSRALRELERAILAQDPMLDLVRDEPVAEEAPPAPAPTAPAHVPDGAAREGRKTVTVLFAGFVTSSTGGDSLDPETVRRVATRVFAEIQSAVDHHGGTIQTITGDGACAVFGLPLVHEDDALRAVRAAHEIRARLVPVCEQLADDLRIRVEVRIAVSTGEVVTGGPIGATGEPLTRSSHLQQAAAAGDILLDEATNRLVRVAVVTDRAIVASMHACRLVELVDAPPGHGGRLDVPMVGRERERRRLHDTFEQAENDRSCQLFTILGAAGVGKSRLAHEFLEGLRGRANVARGRCLPYGEGITYWPILEAVKDIARLDDTGKAQQVVEAIGSIETAGSIEESFSAVRALLEDVAARQPLVVVFDDVHWGESKFLDFVEHLADWSRERPILLLCLARPELFDMRPGWGGGKLNSTSTLLEPLSREECETLIGSLVGDAEIPQNARTRITEASEGNPLFVEEMLSMLIDDGLIVRADGGWTAGGDLESIPVPGTIQALLAARLDRLEPEERAAVEQASVEGKLFHESWVAELAPETLRDGLPEALAMLVRKELIRPARPVFDDERAYRFRHLLIRDAAYESIAKETRAELHERHAGWLQQRVGDQSVELEEIIGYHLEQAFRYRDEVGPLDDSTRALGRRAAELLGSAGRRAFLRSDAPAGINLISRAVAMLAPADPLRVELLPNVRVIQGNADLSWADRVLTEAVEAAGPTGDRRLAGHALVQRGFLRLFSAPEVTPQELFDVAKQAITVFEELGDELGLARGWRLVAQAHYLDRRVAGCAEASERALRHARLAGDPFEEREIVEWLVIALLLGPAHAHEGAARCTRLLEESRDAPLQQAQILGGLAYLVAMQGRAADANELMSRSRTIMDNAAERIWIVAFWCAFVHMLHDDPAAAEHELRPSYDALKKAGETSHFSSISHALATALYHQGYHAEAEVLTHECEEACRANDVHSQILWRSIRAKTLARRGASEAALQLAHAAVELSEASDFLPAHADALADLAEVSRLAGHADEAARALENAARTHESKGNVVAAARARASLAKMN
jgi:DNA-binding SARP family transcriptional activator